MEISFKNSFVLQSQRIFCLNLIQQRRRSLILTTTRQDKYLKFSDLERLFYGPRGALFLLNLVCSGQGKWHS
jgi:hypothetical protein